MRPFEYAERLAERLRAREMGLLPAGREGGCGGSSEVSGLGREESARSNGCVPELTGPASAASLSDSGREPMAVEAVAGAAQEAVSRAAAATAEPVSRPDALAPVRQTRPGRVVA